MVTPMSDSDGIVTQTSEQASVPVSAEEIEDEATRAITSAPPVEDQYSEPSIDIAEAVRRLAERTNQIAAASGQRTFTIRPNEPEQAGEPEIAWADVNAPEGEDAMEAEPEVQAPTPPRTASEIEDARRAVAERIARILERAERAIAEEQPTITPADPVSEPELDPVRAFAQAIAEPAAQPMPKAPRPAGVVLEGMPDFDGPAEPRQIQHQTQRSNGRAFIDDTETFDPGLDPVVMFTKAEQEAKIVNGRAQRLGVLSGKMVNLAPWIVILVLSVLGVVIGLVDTFREPASIDSVGGASTVLAVFGMLLVMSIYFLFTRGRDGDPAN